jgi:DNA-binding MarR family transcriptional regulator
MSKPEPLPLETALRIRDTCLCLNVQRAARRLARRFDDALRPHGLTHGQFSLLVALSRPMAHPMGPVAAMLAMDRTTLTANLKPLERRRLVKVATSKDDRRGRVLTLTQAGRNVLDAALPVWEAEHAAIEPALSDPEDFRTGLRALAA